MRKLILLCGVLTLLLTIGPTALAEPAPLSPTIRVGLATNQINIGLSAESDFTLIDADSKAVIQQFKAAEKVALSTKNGRITVNGKTVEAREISLVASGNNPAGVFNSRRYRGEMSIHRTKGKSGLTIVDKLTMEEYLYGIIGQEISPDWPAEAVKAQAVASRSYALHNLGKHRDDGFDICTTTDCQVYGGIAKEDPRIIKAVNETWGLAVTFRGRPISAMFHSSGGGYTESGETVWGTNTPYLQAVPDYDQKSPQFKWEKRVTPEELSEGLTSVGYNVGQIRYIELSALTKPPVNNSVDRGVSGRVKSLLVSGTAGSAEVSGAKLRTILGLNSTLFDFQVEIPSDKSLAVDITDRYGDQETKNIALNLPPVTERRLSTDKPGIRRIGSHPKEVLHFTGYGWGHGVGLSQWGAKAMAQMAPPGAVEYFKTILKHYYTDVDIQKLY